MREPKVNPKPGDVLAKPATKLGRRNMRVVRSVEAGRVEYVNKSRQRWRCSLRAWREWAWNTDVVEQAEE